MPDPRVAASVNQRLLNESRKIGISHDLLLRRFVFERLLWRLQHSPHARELCLKGAMSFLAVTGDVRRPTKDMDFLGRRSLPMGETLDMLRQVASVPAPSADGIAFFPDDFSAEAIQERSEQPGIRIHGVAGIGNSRIKLKLEIAYGDVLTPAAVGMTYPTVLDAFEAPRILVVSKETMLAEKFEAVCSLGDRNTRFKDFHDIRGLARTVVFDASLAAAAMRATFENRGTPIPETDPVAFSPAFLEDGQRGWSAYLRKQNIRDQQGFGQLVDEIRPLVMGLAGMARVGLAEGAWRPGTGWSPSDPEPDHRAFVPF